jgi:hypothetical protein
MSVSSLLALVVAGAAAFKGKRVKDELGVAAPGRLLLRAINADLRRRVEELEDAIASANVQARRDQELIDLWRERALFAEAPIGAVRPAGVFQLAQQQMAQAQANQQALNAQYHQQNALAQYNRQQNYQNQGLGQAMGLLGAQSLINAELWCNCVPARHDLFLRGE